MRALRKWAQMIGTCIMSDELVAVLREDIRELTGGMVRLSESIIKLTGNLDLLDEKMKHKAEKDDITKDIKLHEMACASMRASSNKSGFWSGMSAGQKATIVTLAITNIGQLIPNITNILK